MALGFVLVQAHLGVGGHSGQGGEQELSVVHHVGRLRDRDDRKNSEEDQSETFPSFPS